MEEQINVDCAMVVAILPFININDKRYRINCLVENMFKWKKEDEEWSLYVRYVTYKNGKFERDEQIVKQKDKEISLSTFYQIETNTPRFDFSSCLESDEIDKQRFVLLVDHSHVRNAPNLDIMNLNPHEIFYHIFADIITKGEYKKLMNILLDSKTTQEKRKQIVELLFELEKKTYPSTTDHQNIFCSRAAACYNLILCMGEVEQTENNNTTLENSISMIIKCADFLVKHSNKE